MINARSRMRHTNAQALSPELRLLAEQQRMTRLRPLWWGGMVAREQRCRARRRVLLSIPRAARSPAEEAELDALALDHLVLLGGVLGDDPRTIATLSDEALAQS